MLLRTYTLWKRIKIQNDSVVSNNVHSIYDCLYHSIRITAREHGKIPMFVINFCPIDTKLRLNVPSGRKSLYGM